MPRTIVVGITGGIATGKSSVLALFAGLGAPTRSADEVARQLMSPGAPLTLDILKAFPLGRDLSAAQAGEPETIDRAALGRIVFADSDALRHLGELTHPAIRADMTSWIQEIRCQHPPVAAVEIPLLFENGLSGLVDHTVVVACREAVQLSRLCLRSNLTEAEALKRIRSQMPLADKINAADDTIDSEASRGDMERQVLDLYRRLAES